MINTTKIKLIIDTLPDLPGVYQFISADDTIIYVGKAKNLKKRVTSYFNKNVQSRKTLQLVRNIKDIRYLVVDSEEEAFLLENNLIKQHQPRYNILLKDGKSYPWICIKKESFSRVFMTRNVIKDGSEYYGPFTSIQTLNLILDFIKDNYQIRNCSLQLDPYIISKRRYKPCLEYHIKNCLAPCIKNQKEEDHQKNIDEIRKIIKGDSDILINYIKDEINDCVENLEFEKADVLSKKINALENYLSKSVVTQTKNVNLDIVGFSKYENNYYISMLVVYKGAIVRGDTINYVAQLEEEDSDILSSAILQLRERLRTDSSIVLVPFQIDSLIDGVNFLVPIKGERKNMLNLAQKTAEEYAKSREKQQEKLNPDQRAISILTQLQKDLGIEKLPLHIECFDNSNTQGTNPVSSCVVFKKAKPSKKDYRHFNVKSVEGPNDYASMYEAVYRRYKRVIEEDGELPQLIVIDGGLGQLGMAKQAIEDLNLSNKLRLIGIAKRLEEIYLDNDNIPIYIDKTSYSLKLIQQLRDEAHRFGITLHRKKRSKSQIQSELDSIEGIGTKTKDKLLSHYKSVKRMREASSEDLINEIGKAKAKILLDYFSKHN